MYFQTNTVPLSYHINHEFQNLVNFVISYRIAALNMQNTKSYTCIARMYYTNIIYNMYYIYAILYANKQYGRINSTVE